jgi:tetratricopeptide (TPR) repeat protein
MAQQAVARMANILGWIYMQRGEFVNAQKAFLDALEQYRLIDNQIGEAITLQHISSIYRKQGEFKSAKQYCDSAWQIAESLDDGDLKALIQTVYGKLARDEGQWTLAWDYFIQVRDWFERRTGQTPRDEPLLRGNWGHLAIIAYHLNRPREAKDYCLRSLEFFEKLGTKGYLATLKYRLALAEKALGEFDYAKVHARESVDWFDRLGMKPDYIEAIKLFEELENCN